MDDARARQAARRDVLLLHFAVFLWGAGEGLFLYIQPLYVQELGANPAQIGAILSLVGLAGGLTYIPSGLLSDRLPRKPLLMSGWVLGMLGAVSCALARDWRALIPALFVYGLSYFSLPAIQAYLAAAVGGREVERVFSANLAAYTAGSVLFPALGGMLAETLSTRSVYLVAAGIFGLSALTVSGISPQYPVGGGGLRGGWRRLAGSRFCRFAVIILLVFFSMHLTFPLAPNYVSDVRGLNKAQVGMLGSVAAVGITLFSLVLGRLGARWRSSGLQLGQGLVWLSAALLLWAPGIGGAALAFLLRGACYASQPLVNARGGRLLGESHRGLALGATGTVVVLAQVLASVVAGRLYAAGPAWPFLVALILIPAGAVVGLRLPDDGRV